MVGQSQFFSFSRFVSSVSAEWVQFLFTLALQTDIAFDILRSKALAKERARVSA